MTPLRLFNDTKHHVWRAVMMLALCVAGKDALGAACTGGSHTVNMPFPGTITVSRDAPVGQLLTGWIDSPARTDYWVCNPGIKEKSVFPLERAALLGPATGLTVSPGRLPATAADIHVYATQVEGVGLAIVFREYVGDIGWTYWTSAGGWGTSAPMIVGAQVSMALVKTGPVGAGSLPAGTVASIYEEWNGVPNPSNTVYFNMPSVAVIARACSTNDTLVSLGSYSLGTFKGVGSVSPSAAFGLAIKNCPSGMNRVRYRIDAVYGSNDGTSSVMPLDPGATASGLGVQLLDAADVAHSLGSWKNFTSYQPVGGDFTLPLKARMVQQDDAVQAGSILATATFTMSYE